MSDALDRIAPEDKKGDLYRHSAEGLDDMPVSAQVRWEMSMVAKSGCRLLISESRHI